VPNFVKIGQTIAEIWRLNNYEDGGHLQSWILKVEILTNDRVETVKMRHHTKFREDW